MPTAGVKFLKIVSSNMQKQKRVARCRGKFLKYGTFKIQGRVYFLYDSPTPLVKLGGPT